MVNKNSYWHGKDSELGMFTYTCIKCGTHVDKFDYYCKNCGIEFVTGETHKSNYKRGYEQAKLDIVRLIQGGKNNVTK